MLARLGSLGARSMLALFMMLSLTVRAQDAATISDIRCIVVGVKLAGMQEPSHRTVGTMLILYYMGRIDGRHPKLAIRDLIANEVSKLDSQAFAYESERCRKALAAKGLQIELIGKSLTDRPKNATSTTPARQ